MAISVIGFLLAIAVVIYGVFKGYNFIFLAIIGSLIVAVTNGLNIVDAFLAPENSFVSGMGGFFEGYFLMFLLSAVFAKYMDESGAAESIANWILGFTGEDNPYLILVAIYVIGAILTYGGLLTFVVLFVLIPLARKLFKRLNIPWHLVMTPYFLGIGTFSVTGLPGSPQVQNIILSESLGTPLTAAPWVGLISSVAFIIWALWRMRVELNQAQALGLEFDEKYDPEVADDPNKELPNIFISILPIISLIGAILIGTNMGESNAIYYALVIAVVLSAVLFHKHINGHKKIINEGVQNSISTTVLPAAAVGFGAVLQLSPGLNYVIDGIQQLPISPMITLSLLTFLIAYAIGSASGALGIVTRAIVPLYDLSSIHPEVVHRLMLIPAVNYAPHNNAVLTFYEVTGLDHQSSYRNFNIAVHGGILIQYIVAYIAASILY